MEFEGRLEDFQGIFDLRRNIKLGRQPGVWGVLRVTNLNLPCPVDLVVQVLLGLDIDRVKGRLRK